MSTLQEVQTEVTINDVISRYKVTYSSAAMLVQALCDMGVAKRSGYKSGKRGRPVTVYLVPVQVVLDFSATYRPPEDDALKTT